MKVHSLLLIIISCCIFSSCSDQKKTNDRLDEFYIVINELLKSDSYDVDIVILDLLRLQKVPNEELYMLPDLNSEKLIPPPPPPSPGKPRFCLLDFKHLESEGLISSEDVNYMYNQIDSATKIILDPLKIDRKALAVSDIRERDQKAEKGFFDYLAEEYNNPSFILLSTPIFSKNCDKIYFYMEYHPFEQFFYAYKILFQKKNGKWSLLNRNLLYMY